MMRFRAGLLSLWQRALALWRRVISERVMRRRAIAVSGAMLLLLLASGLVIAAMAPAAAPKQQAVAQVTATATNTPTPTATATATVTPRPTAKPKAKPVPKTPPPPPALPTPPPAPPPPPPSTTGTITIGDSMFSQFCSATSTPTSGGSTSGAPAPTATATPYCVPCPYTAGNNPSQSQIASALAQAASTYGLPVNLLKAVAWQESKWHEDVYSCDGGIGLMQIQYYIYPWLNQVSIPIADCAMSSTNYDPYTLQGNADLGAKYLKYLYCFYSFWGGYNYDINNQPHSLSNPSKYTADWYYQQAGLPYPDSSLPNSLCAAVFNANAYYPDLPSATSAPWSCPYSAVAGDNTVLDMTVSAYNAGPGVTDQYGIQTNAWYVYGVEGYIPKFSSGALPIPS